MSEEKRNSESATEADPADRPGNKRPDRAGLLVAAAVLAACGGLVLYGVLGTDGDNESAPKKHTPTTAVTYEVTGTGTADLTYQARSETGKATVVQDSRLPWHKTVQVPLGQDPLISLVLDEHGGTARCTLAIRGHHAQSATATGAFGRATCSSPLPNRQN
ncbi:hypothetical protein [Streptomyces sp. NPDC002619]|uniref:hypothetical protein n=1 Tax=Streptomyces sp. NPDC002619 TaxID=3364655 RepID=UPI0036BE6261